MAVTRVPGSATRPTATAPVPQWERHRSGPVALLGWAEQSSSCSICRSHLHPHRVHRAVNGRAIPVPSSPQLTPRPCSRHKNNCQGCLVPGDSKNLPSPCGIRNNPMPGLPAPLT